MPCGSSENNPNFQTHYCEYPYTRDGPNTDIYGIKAENLGGIASSDPLEVRRAQLIKLVCQTCSKWKKHFNSNYSSSINQYAMQPWHQLSLNVLDRALEYLFNQMQNLPESALSSDYGSLSDGYWIQKFDDYIKQALYDARPPEYKMRGGKKTRRRTSRRRSRSKKHKRRY